jgi:Flp pilus assembly protein protease CpaA
MLNPSLPLVIAVGSSLLAVFWDLHQRRIPNRISVYTTLLGAALNLAVACSGRSGFACIAKGLGPALAGGAFLLVCAGVLSVLGLLGFGDTKLLGAIGVCVGWPLAPRVLVCVVISGGVIALAYMLTGRLGAAVWRNLRRLPELRGQRVDEDPLDLHAFPYATAIAFGTVWAIAGRYVPELALF